MINKKYTYIGIITFVVLLITTVLIFQGYNQENDGLIDMGTVQDPEEAYIKTKETFILIATQFKTAREDLNYINEFNKTKNKFLKEN
jgi:hypothetical protein